MPGLAKSLFYSLLFLGGSLPVFSQTTCIDYDKARYPITVNGVSYNWNPIWNFPNMTQTKVTGLGFTQFKNNFFKGLLEHLPNDYNPANTAQKYPIIIFFHGTASRGNGTVADLCKLFKDAGSDLATHLSVPGRIERNPGLFTQTYLTQTYKYIVASPQYTVYTRAYNPDGTPKPGNVFSSAAEVEQVINYLVNSRYANKVDLRRIYLVGYSSGANMIIEYAGSSVARAKRIAAIMPVSLCSQLNHQSNTSAGITASNIAKAGLKTWFVYCTNDNCGINPPLNVPQNWVTGIKAAGGATPRLTMLTKTIPRGLYSCSDTLAHDTWSRAFDPNFKASFVGNGNVSNANDGINKNMYEWFTQQLSATLPVTLKSFTAKFAGNKVQLNWMTTDEKDNASFTIERADADQKFISLDTIGGANNYSGEKAYSYTDASPITGLGFYRLVQTDIDGKKTYLEIRKVLNQSTENQQVVVFPNPFSAEVSAFVSLQASQKVIVLLTDISGKTIRTTNGVYAKGTSEIRIRSSDLPGGIYFLKVQGTDFNFIRKIVKQ